MGKKIELYQCKSVPKKIPGFIDPHITVDRGFDGKRIYIIEIDALDLAVVEAKRSAGGVEKLLEGYGIVQPEFACAAERPDFF